MLKKFLRGFSYVILFLVLLRACGIITIREHEHEWQDATCSKPRSCATCEATDGDPLGHDWEDATCTTPKTCQACGKTEGQKAEHTYLPATCTEPEVCVCGRENLYSSPLGHDWIAATLTSPFICARCGEQDGEPLSKSSFNRGNYDRWTHLPSADQYVGMAGYVAVTHETYLYPSSTSPYENNWLSAPWFASTYEKDKQFYNAVGVVEHKTPVVVIGQELTADNRPYRYYGFLLVERIDSGEQFYISVTDFVAEPYWESFDAANIPYASPYLAVYNQRSDYYPVDRNGKKANITEGEPVFISGNYPYTTSLIDALTKNGRCFFNADDLTIVY